jgi:hypothetical protein
VQCRAQDLTKLASQVMCFCTGFLWSSHKVYAQRTLKYSKQVLPYLMAATFEAQSSATIGSTASVHKNLSAVTPLSKRVHLK